MIKKIITLPLLILTLFLVSCTTTSNDSNITITIIRGEGFENTTETIKKGGNLTTLEEPTRDGYRFMGWYLDSNLSREFTTDYKFNQDANVYAKFNRLFKLTYNLNGGVTTEKLEYELIYNEEISLLDANQVTKDDSRLVGWSDGVNVYTSNVKYTMPNQDVTLTALYETKVEIAFDLNGGTGDLTVLEAFTGENVTINYSSLNKGDTEFYGWLYGNQIYDKDEQILINGTNNTLLALWNEKISVTLDKGELGQNETIEYDFLTVLSLPDLIIEPKYEFYGWEVYNDIYLVGEEIIVSHDITLKANYEIKKFDVVFKDWDGTILLNSKVPYGTDAEAYNGEVISVSEFTGWDKEFNNVLSDLIITAMYDYTPSNKLLFNYDLIDDKYYYISKASGVTLPETIYLPHSYRGKLIKGTVNKTNLAGAFIDDSNIVNVYIPSSYEMLGRSAFKSCDKLERVYITGNNLLTIEDDCFMSSNLFGEFTIPSSVTKLGTRVFYATAIKEIIISENIEEIGLNCFFNCPDFKNIIVSENNKNYKSVNGVLFNKTLTELISYPCGKTETEYVVSSTVTRLAEYSFNNVLLLQNLVFENIDSLKEIGNYAFSSSANIKSIYLPASLTNIGENIFYGVTAEITLGNFTSIPDKLFYYYRGSKIVIPDTVETIGEEAFRACSITDYVFTDKNSLKTIKRAAFYETKGLEEFDFSILSKLEIIGDFAFYGSTVDEVNLSNTVKIIGESAFEKSKITKVTFASGYQLELIQASAFFECSNLVSVEFYGNPVDSELETTFERWAFTDSTKLETVIFPSSLIRIGNLAFGSYYGNDMSITSIVLPEKLKIIEGGAFSYNVKMNSITLNDELEMIGEGVFKNNKLVKTLHIPAKITFLGNRFLEGCDALNTVTVDPNNQYYESVDGSLYQKVDRIFIGAFNISSGVLTIKEGTIEIAENACKYDLRIVTVNFPQSIVTIGSDAFQECLNLTTINFPENCDLKVIKESAFSANQLESQPFMNITNLKLPNKLEVLEVFAFFRNDKLGDLVIPSSVKEIQGYVFYTSTTTTKIVIEENSKLTSIGAYAFSKMEKLTEVIINSDVLGSIGAGAFNNNPLLETFELHSANTVIARAVFHQTNENLKIYVPEIAVTEYRNRENWVDVADKIYPIK